jgi:DNA invertase Pin-like site-specific DNA recombinase
MIKSRWVSYLRVSTERQGQSGLGLEAQRAAVATFIGNGNGRLLREFVEVESGRKNNRPQLAAAIAYAKVTGAKLLVAKLDRLSRNVAFLANLMESDIEFVAADNPHVNRLTIHILAAVAEDEAHRISERTKRALGSIKVRIGNGGTYRTKAGRIIRRLGNPNGAAALRGRGNAEAAEAVKRRADLQAQSVRPIIDAIKAEGAASLHAIARQLNEREIRTARGGRWYATSVRNLMGRGS